MKLYNDQDLLQNNGKSTSMGGKKRTDKIDQEFTVIEGGDRYMRVHFTVPLLWVCLHFHRNPKAGNEF